MKELSRTGYLVESSPEVKKDLTVRPVIQGDYGGTPPSFKVFKTFSKGLCVPRYYGLERFGQVDHDKRPQPTVETIPFHGVLRDATHQNEALQKAVDIGHGVLSLPCGYGKTTVALALASRLGFRTLVIVHKEFLANQWRERIKQFCPGTSVGIIQQNKIDIDHPFVIGMLQSISMKEYSYETFEKFGTVIIDEAHHVCAQVFSQALFKMCPNHIYGLSATPIRKDGLTMILDWFIGPVFFSVETENRGNVKVHIEPYKCEKFEEAPPTSRFGKILMSTMITELTEIEERNDILIKLIEKIVKDPSRHLLVLSDRRNHCFYLHEVFKNSSGLYLGGMKQKDLDESSKKKIIFATYSQAHEGLDIPSLNTLLLATPKSDIVQSIGRIMRGTKGSPVIYDIWDHWSVLHSMFYKRKKIYKEKNFNFEDDEPPPIPKLTGFAFQLNQ